ncbi:MAG: outer membrane beta-barrel protein [Rickettsiales bacterium]|jgi:opacity protein-like surface antigen|nr:outer membrane beta-barrel protein [Rickettsiales bacterium]
MKKLVLTSLTAVLAVGAANAATPYASLKLGYISNLDPEYTSETTIGGVQSSKGSKGFTGFTGSVAGGASFDVSKIVAVRGELEYSYANTKYADEDSSEDIKVSEHLIMANAYADFKTGSDITPYVGLGIGYDFATSGLPTGLPFDETSLDGLAYGFSAGAAYAINQNLSLDLGVKYTIKSLSGEEKVAAWNDTLKLDVDTNALSVTLGARYAF